MNVNFAPVADVGEDARCYGTDAKKVTVCVKEAVKGSLNAGIIPTLKHFPGLGKGEADTHFEKVTVSAEREILENEDLAPFRALIKDYPEPRFMIMVSHIMYTAFDEKNPASVSPAIITGLLRNETGWDGIVVTDDLGMGALKDITEENLAVKAAKAGADILLMAHDRDMQRESYFALLSEVKIGKIPEERINASVRRILRAKVRMSDAASR